MTDREIGRAIELQVWPADASPWPGDILIRVGRAARTILAAERPEVTREDVRIEVERRTSDWSRNTSHSMECRIDLVWSLLSHFAPPREARPIDGMSVEEIEDRMRRDWAAGLCGRGDGSADDQFKHCARVAHRLAQPAPVVDPPEVRARAMFQEAIDRGWDVATKDPDWIRRVGEINAELQAAAAAKEVPGDE